MFSYPSFDLKDNIHWIFHIFEFTAMFTSNFVNGMIKLDNTFVSRYTLQKFV